MPKKKLTPKQAEKQAADALLKSCTRMYKLMMESKHEPYEEKHFRKMMDYVLAARDAKKVAKKRLRLFDPCFPAAMSW